MILTAADSGARGGYRCLTFVKSDQDVVAVSPSSVYRVLSQAGRLSRGGGKPSAKGTGFVQPTRPHEHWHIDVSHLNICGTFYYLCSILRRLQPRHRPLRDRLRHAPRHARRSRGTDPRPTRSQTRRGARTTSPRSAADGRLTATLLTSADGRRIPFPLNQDTTSETQGSTSHPAGARACTSAGWGSTNAKSSRKTCCG
jgi:hypothetical protein